MTTLSSTARGAEPVVLPPNGLAASFRRIGALVKRYVYLLRSSGVRLVELIYWPFLQMLTWGFLQKYLAATTSPLAQGAGAFPHAADELRHALQLRVARQLVTELDLCARRRLVTAAELQAPLLGIVARRLEITQGAFDLRRIDPSLWVSNEDACWIVHDRLAALRHYPLVSARQARDLARRVDELAQGVRRAAVAAAVGLDDRPHRAIHTNVSRLLAGPGRPAGAVPRTS